MSDRVVQIISISLGGEGLAIAIGEPYNCDYYVRGRSS